ncbi:MAG: HAMP domain-containing protein [Planctomycetaceae bacterium]|nr:HAMP domain-containing protein [Planctomycetaceae bacterium]
MKLATRIIGASLVSVVLLTIAAGALLVKNIELEFELQQQETAERISRAFSAVLIDAWKSNGRAGVLRFLSDEGPAKTLGIDVRWVQFERNAGPDLLPLLPPELWPSDADAETQSIIQTEPDGERQLYTYVPLLVEGRVIGAIEFEASLSQLERQTRQIIVISLAMIGVISLVLIIVAYLTGLLWIGRPLGVLMEKAERIGRGDFTAPIHLAQNDELGTLATSLNQMCDRLIEQRNSIEQETTRRIQAIEQLRHADRLKTVGHLAAGVAHELGTPLNVIGGRAALIASGKLSDDQTRDSARAIKDETDHIADIVRQLLAFARLRQPEPARTDLDQVIGKTVELVQTLAERNHVQLDVRTPDTPVSAMIDASQIQQVLTNIVMNAIQAMPGGGQITISTTMTNEQSETAQDRSMACIRVTDTGPGIPEETLQQIFDPFFTTKDVGEGTGLGLSIALGIVQEHGGHIEAESQPGNGTTFRIYLPTESST